MSTGEGRPLAAVIQRIPPRLRVATFAVVLTGVGISLLSATRETTSIPDRPWTLPFVVLALGFFAAEATALHVEIRKESHSLSLGGIPLMFGVLFTSPLLVALAYVVGAIPALLWIRKSDWLKAVWNASLFFAEAALASFIVRSALGERLPENAAEWLIPLGAMLAAELMSLIAVPLVIMSLDVQFRPQLFTAIGRAQLLAILAGTFTVTTVAASMGSPYMAAYALLPIIGVGALLRSTGHLGQRFKDLQQLHTFTRALTDERGQRTVDVGLLELVQIMRSKTAGLVTIGRTPDHATTMRVLFDDVFRDSDPSPVADRLIGLLDDTGVVLLTENDTRPEVREVLAALQAHRMLAVRVLREIDRVGVLFVTDRLGMRSEFTSDEVRLFGSLANTLSARLSNDHLFERLEVQARLDALTGLPNRLSFEVALASCLSREQQQGVVVMIDLDRFKEINDSLGHETGDRLLIEIGDRLRAAARSTDVVARFGGDEFALLLRCIDGEDISDLSGRVNSIRDALTAKVELAGIKFAIGASLGVVQWPAQGNDSATLLRRADTAMYEAKRNQLEVVWYSPSLDAETPRRLDLYLSVGTALERGEFHIHYQPKLSIADGTVIGAEALVRWTHPTHGPIPPNDFVPLVVQAGMIGKLTRFVTTEAVRTAAHLRSIGIDLPIAVNLTPRDLLDPMLVHDIAAIIHDAGVEAEVLQMEITEDAMLIDLETCISVLGNLRDLGVCIALDDFGTGYSSLQHLHRLPVDQLKIDRSFINRLTADESAAAVVRASISIADDLGLTTVAEGVEDVDTLRELAVLGCQEIQGFLVSRPLPVTDFIDFVGTWDPQQLRSRLASVVPSDRKSANGTRAVKPATPGHR